MFRKNWTTKQKCSVVFNENELRLISNLNDVENIFPDLKKTVTMANSSYLDSLKQAEAKKRQAQEKAKQREEKELGLRQNISSTLKKLNSPANQ